MLVKKEHVIYTYIYIYNIYTSFLNVLPPPPPPKSIEIPHHHWLRTPKQWFVTWYGKFRRDVYIINKYINILPYQRQNFKQIIVYIYIYLSKYICIYSHWEHWQPTDPKRFAWVHRCCFLKHNFANANILNGCAVQCCLFNLKSKINYMYFPICFKYNVAQFQP